MKIGVIGSGNIGGTFKPIEPDLLVSTIASLINL